MIPSPSFPAHDSENRLRSESLTPRDSQAHYHAKPDFPTQPLVDPHNANIPVTASAHSSATSSRVQSASMRAPARELTRFERMEAWLSRLSIKNNFWHKVFSLVWLPYAFRSGIRMHGFRKGRAAEAFAAILPFRRFNRNFYDAMAGAALLGNSEVAAGMYLFSVCGGDYTIVCKEMKYRFLRPCLGPAIYRVVKSQDVEEKVAEGGEFNVALEMEIFQQKIVKTRDETLVGRCDITFHCTPKSMVRERSDRRKARKERLSATRDPSTNSEGDAS